MERKSDIALRIEEFDWKARQNWAKERLKTELIKYVGGLQNRAEMYAEIGRIRRDLENSLRRWAYTMETHRVVQNSLAEMREVGISSYRIVAEEDEKTTDLCQILDGEVFDINEASVGMNLPPFHFHCRCRVERVDAFTLSRDEEIELIMAFLRYVSEWGNEEGGWRTRLATERELRRIAEDLVDLLRVFEEFVDENGFFNILNEDVFERYEMDVFNAIFRLTWYPRQNINRLHGAFATGRTWPYVNVEILFQLAMEQAIPNSRRLTATYIGAGVLVVGGVIFLLPKFLAGAGASATVGTASGTVVKYWDKIKSWLGLGGDRLVPQLSNRAAQHAANPARSVPLQTLMDTIRFGQSFPDPHGTTARAYYMLINKNGNFYNLQVIFDRTTNTIWHFHYTREALGPLQAILR